MEPIVKDLPCSLEELFNGCTKKLAVTRKRLIPNDGGVPGTNMEYVDDVKQLVVSVKPGWKQGTKITFFAEGDEGPNIVPADLVCMNTITLTPHLFFFLISFHLLMLTFRFLICPYII